MPLTNTAVRLTKPSCQGRSKTLPVGRSKSRPVGRLQVEGFAVSMASGA